MSKRTTRTMSQTRSSTSDTTSMSHSRVPLPWLLRHMTMIFSLEMTSSARLRSTSMIDSSTLNGLPSKRNQSKLVSYITRVVLSTKVSSTSGLTLILPRRRVTVERYGSWIRSQLSRLRYVFRSTSARVCPWKTRKAPVMSSSRRSSLMMTSRRLTHIIATQMVNPASTIASCSMWKRRRPNHSR